LENADGEMDQANRFKYQVTNDDLERAVKEIAGIITVELSRTSLR
jgi:guanylate kinase